MLLLLGASWTMLRSPLALCTHLARAVEDDGCHRQAAHHPARLEALLRLCNNTHRGWVQHRSTTSCVLGVEHRHVTRRRLCAATLHASVHTLMW